MKLNATANPLRLYGFLYPLLFLLINLALKLLFVTSRDIALDEPFTLYYSQQDISAIVNMLYHENNPPLHFILMHYVIKWFGMSPFVVRLPSVLFSSLAAMYLVKIGQRFFTLQVGIVAASIFSLATMHIYFSHEARVYPLFCLLTVMSLYYFLQLANHPGKLIHFLLLFVINVLLIYSHYFGFFVVFIQLLTCYFLSKRNRVGVMLVFVALAVAYLPMVYLFFHRFAESTQLGTWVSAPAITEYYGNLNRFLNNRWNMAVLLLVAAISIFIAVQNKQFINFLRYVFSSKNTLIVLLWFFVPYTLMFLISFKMPMFIDRYIVFTSLPFYLFIACILQDLPIENTLRTAFTAVILVSMCFTINLNPDNNRRLYQVAEMVKELKTPHTLTLLAPDYAYMGFAYHYNAAYFKAAPETLKLLANDNIYTINSVESETKLVNNNTFTDCLYIQAGTEFIDPQDQFFTNLITKFTHHREYKIFEIYTLHQFTNKAFSDAIK